MIHIRRGPCPQNLVVYTAKTVRVSGKPAITRAKKELLEAIAFFTDKVNYHRNKKLTPLKFRFKVYKDTDLGRALETIFGTKCAYCESHFGHVTPKEVEHFRPKSEIEVKGKPKRAPGYFWLAGTWENLLVSCVDCNRAREHDLPGKTERVLLGKQAQFPLLDEKLRVRRRATAVINSVSKEEPARLLIDPCFDDPELFLTFDDTGLIHPKLPPPKATPHASVSIEVYALQRGKLVKERLIVLNELIKRFEELRGALRDYANFLGLNASANILQGKRDDIVRIRASLMERMQPTARFAGMSRDYVRRTRTAGGFDDLIANGVDPATLLPQPVRSSNA